MFALKKAVFQTFVWLILKNFKLNLSVNIEYTPQLLSQTFALSKFKQVFWWFQGGQKLINLLKFAYERSPSNLKQIQVN